MKTYRGIGMMTGTSMDGLDIACCDFTQNQDTYSFEVVQAECMPLDERWKNRLYDLYHQPAEVFAKTHVYFGHWLGKQAQAFIERHKLEPDFVASHGQTIFHQPEKSFTTQIGDGESMVAYLPCPAVTNFRNKDVALGGEGAPLVPFGEKYLFPDHQLFLNLGGIANLSYQGRAFDVSPCNLVLNAWARHASEDLTYDPNGEIAASGQVVPQLLEALNQLPYYRQKPPKSLGQEWITANFLPIIRPFQIGPEDVLRTVVAHIAQQIGNALKRMRVKSQEMLVSGGGYHNTFLLEQIAQELKAVDVKINTQVSHELVDYKEAIIFAFLGLHTLLGSPNVLTAATGARFASVGGSVHLPPKGGISLL